MSRFSVLVRLVIWMIISFLSTSIFAQRSLIRTYTVGDGLVMNRVRGFHQDKDGFIWIYTWDGLSRYEGYRFRNYIATRDLKHSFVNDIFELEDGTMYLPLNDGSLALMRNQVVDPEVLMPGEIINDFCIGEKGQMYVGTDHHGIQLFENGKLTPITSKGQETTIIQIVYHQDHFFFIGPSSGPSGVLDKKMNLVGSWHGASGYYSTIYKDHSDRIFVCTIEGLKEVDLASPSFALKVPTVIPPGAPWKNWNASSVIVTPENELWLGTNQGLVHLRRDMTWKVITVQDGLLSNKVNSLFLDKSNTLWIGTDAGAASINLQTNIEDNRNLPGLYSNFILPGNNGSAYVITGHTFLNLFNNQLNLIRSDTVGADTNPVLAIHPGKKSMLLFKVLRIEELDPEQYPLPQPDIVNPGILYTSHQEKFWITSVSGFICASSPGPFKLVNDPHDYATSIGHKGDHLIIGTLQSGLFVARPHPSPDSCRFERVKDLTAWIDDPAIRSLMISKNGDIWIGTRFGGLFRLRCNEDYSDCTTQSFSISDGLNSNWITSLAEDQYGNMWVGSASGIDKLIPKDDDYFVFPFSQVNGYYANVRHLVIHPDGSLWVGHNEGVARIIDGRIDTVGPPNTFITEATLGGDEYSTTYASQVKLRYHQNSAHFAFAAPDYINSSQLMFTYRLLGSKDTTWSRPVTTHEIFYGNLTPGRFQFEVAAFGWNGERSRPIRYAFEILKPFWKQTWFIILSIFLIGAAAFGLYRFRISQMQHVQSVRDRIAADLHDDIASSLTHINILSEIGKQQRPGNSGPGLFERIGSEVQTSSEALDDIIWSVRTRRDSIGDVLARMRQYAAEIFEPLGIQLHIKENVEGIQSLEMEFKRDFYLVYKELLRNILKHAEATQVDIAINVNRTKVAIQITDNGKGFDIDLPTQRSGLSNIKARVKKWNGTVSWKSGQGKGTQVIVEMQPG